MQPHHHAIQLTIFSLLAFSVAFLFARLRKVERRLARLLLGLSRFDAAALGEHVTVLAPKTIARSPGFNAAFRPVVDALADYMQALAAEPVKLKWWARWRSRAPPTGQSPVVRSGSLVGMNDDGTARIRIE